MTKARREVIIRVLSGRSRACQEPDRLRQGDKATRRQGLRSTTSDRNPLPLGEGRLLVLQHQQQGEGPTEPGLARRPGFRPSRPALSLPKGTASFEINLPFGNPLRRAHGSDPNHAASTPTGTLRSDSRSGQRSHCAIRDSGATPRRPHPRFGVPFGEAQSLRFCIDVSRAGP